MSLSLFLAALTYAALVHAACSCYSCLSGAPCGVLSGPADDAVLIDLGGIEPTLDGGIAAFRVNNRWGRTASHGSTLRGTPVTLTWGFAPDGTSLPSETQDDDSVRSDPSDLIAFLDAQVGNAGDSAVTDLQQKSWFPVVQDAYDRWAELSGVTFVYEPNDDGVPISGSSSSSRWGSRGVRADMRLGGHFIDGQSGSNTLAYNWYPGAGDMVIDTSNAGFYSNDFADYRRLRNVLMHELGHGLGVNHLESDNSNQLMEPFISTSFDGPQIDDILAMHRNYGDVYEKGAGNDSLGSPAPIGEFGEGDAWSIGVDGAATSVSNTQTDFISIDGRSDTDNFAFTVSERVSGQIILRQLGAAYNEGPQGGTQSSLDTARLNPLDLTLYSATGEGIAVLAESVPRGDTIRYVLPVNLFPGGDYRLRVRGTVDNVQLYRLDLAFRAFVAPEPAALTAALAALAVAGLGRRAA